MFELTESTFLYSVKKGSSYRVRESGINVQQPTEKEYSVNKCNLYNRKKNDTKGGKKKQYRPLAFSLINDLVFD